jgi:serine kinase of HPr protein (carbohydrate metabolism regulator)
MSAPRLSSETVHATAVAIHGRAVLIGGRSGTGKSDLALRLIDRGAALISDDYTHIRRVRDQAIAGPPATIAGKIEVRGVGVVEYEPVADVPVALFIDLDREPDRLPDMAERRMLAGVSIPTIGLAAHEASAPLKVEAALRLHGLTA